MSKHYGTKVKFGITWNWIHWIKPDGTVIILVSRAV